jgi:hypothetical protein
MNKMETKIEILEDVESSDVETAPARDKAGYILPDEHTQVTTKYSDPEMNEIMDELKQAAIDSAIADADTITKEVGCCGEVTHKITPAAPYTYTYKSKVFKSSLVVVEYPTSKFEVCVPLRIWNVCNELQTNLGSNEFSIVCKGTFNKEGKFVVSKEYAVPKQEVAGASVDYDNEDLQRLKLEGWNVIIHSHPFNCASSSFSQSDKDTINTHFDCSILFSCKDFTFSTMSFPVRNGIKLVVESDVSMMAEEGSEIVSKAEYDKIQKKVYTYNENDYWYGYDGRYDSRYNRKLYKQQDLDEFDNGRYKNPRNNNFRERSVRVNTGDACGSTRARTFAVQKDKKVFTSSSQDVHQSDKKIREPKSVNTQAVD